MGRELKRVPLDFNWPLNILWKGYLNPYSPTECKLCGGSGLNPETKKLSDNWYTHLRTDGKEGWGKHLEQEDVDALIEHHRLHDLTQDGYHPTAKEVNNWSRKGMGHDSINQWICVEERAKRLGFYGKCLLCGGEGQYWCEAKYEVLWKSWEAIEPPKGDGFQLWDTTSEGMPKSPVFKTLEELCSWCAENATTFGKNKTTKEGWMKMLSKNFVYHQEGNNVFM